MAEVQGITLLYSEYHSMHGTQILLWISIILLVGFCVWVVVDMIKSHMWDIWPALLIILVLGTLWCVFLWSIGFPYTDYYVTIDESASFTELEETFDDNIHHEGGNVYRIQVTDYD